jgi:hypothetical protein
MVTAEQISKELESFYKSYIAGFNREDIDAFTESFAYPYAWVSGRHGLSQCATDSDHQRSFAKIMADLKERAGCAQPSTAQGLGVGRRPRDDSRRRHPPRSRWLNPGMGEGLLHCPA